MSVRALVTAAAGAATVVLLALPAQAAPFDGDWEGSLRCEATAAMPGIYEPALASVKGAQMKLLRGAESDADVLTGTLAGDGNARVSGRTMSGDGTVMYLNFGGRFVPGHFQATGTAVADGGGQVRPCNLTLQPAVVARGEGGPPPASIEEDEAQKHQPPAPPVVVYGPDFSYPGYPTWYDDNYAWRRVMLRRWQSRLWQRQHEIGIFCGSNPRACGAPAEPQPPQRPPGTKPLPPQVVAPPQGPMQPLPPKRIPPQFNNPLALGEQPIKRGQPPAIAEHPAWTQPRPSSPIIGKENGVTVVRPEPVSPPATPQKLDRIPPQRPGVVGGTPSRDLPALSRPTTPDKGRLPPTRFGYKQPTAAPPPATVAPLGKPLPTANPPRSAAPAPRQAAPLGQGVPFEGLKLR